MKIRMNLGGKSMKSRRGSPPGSRDIRERDGLSARPPNGTNDFDASGSVSTRSDESDNPHNGHAEAQAEARMDRTLRTLARYLVLEHEARASLVPPAVFREALDAERSRADRTGSRFSMLLLTTQSLDSVPDEAVGDLLDELRGGDSVCILEGGVVAALLPYTERGGANSVLDRVLVRGPWRGSASRIIVYPHDAWADITDAGVEPVHLPGPRSVDRDLYPVEKRITDVVLAGSVVLLLSPVLLALAAWIKVVSRGPVIFRQNRVGLGGRQFEMMKFRTMHQDNRVVEEHREHSRSFIENDDPMPKAKLPLIAGGWFIRNLCLDELPQLFNVLRGEMSIVGPRPCLPYEAEAYQQWHWRRFSMMPGITGLWQVSGKNRLTFNQMVRLDLRYARGLSWSSDAMILLRTAPAIAREFLFSAGHSKAG